MSSKISPSRTKLSSDSTATQNPDQTLAATRPKWLRPLIWVMLTLALDLGSKALAQVYIDPWAPIEVIPGFFNLVLVYNTGGAFSLLAGDGATQGLKMAALAAVALLPFIYFYVKALPGDRGLLTSLGLVWGGALGNIHDRLRLNKVVDFFDFYWVDYHWPAFNVADIAICLGAGLLALSILREKPPAKADADAS
jgi:lipoprotein signal peptidase